MHSTTRQKETTGRGGKSAHVSLPFWVLHRRNSTMKLDLVAVHLDRSILPPSWDTAHCG